MVSNTYLLVILIVLFETINTLPHYRHRRQINPAGNNNPSYDPRAIRENHPSGSIEGTYYYGVGADPNYGSFIQRPNRPNDGGILPISYDPNSNLNGYLVNPNNQYQTYISNNNNAWQRPNTNGYYNQNGNRYPAGSPGWYATGGNYWYNNGLSIIAQPCLLMINILILIICK